VDARFDESIEKPSKISSPRTGEGIVLDIGTGDGLFVYQSARRNPNKFYLGIDANPRALEKVSERVHRKPAKGGLPNVRFVQAAVEDLPEELNGIASEIHVHFPWGSLMQALGRGEERVLRNLRRVCAVDALLEVVIALDPERDRPEIERLGLPAITVEYVDLVLKVRYRQAGFEIFERGSIPPSRWPRLDTSWARRLERNSARSVVYFLAAAK
jgi:16S rRNA (adenine(1408)-N(1))-methyltransferase